VLFQRLAHPLLAMSTVTYTYVSSKNCIQAHIHSANKLRHIKLYFSERLSCATWVMARSRRFASNFPRNKNKTLSNCKTPKWPFETAEKRTGLEFRLRCGEVGRPAAALHFASGLHAALRYLLRSGTRASVLKTSSSLEECLTSGIKGICGRSPERTTVAPPLVSWHRRVTSDLFEPDIGL